MGYYAHGSGDIDFAKILTEKEKEKVGKCVGDVFEYDFCKEGYRDDHTVMSFWLCDNKYYDDVVQDVLKDVADLVPISEGNIVFYGEDDEIWRYVYDENGWVDEAGRVVFSDITSDEAYIALRTAFKSYVNNDLLYSNGLHVIDVLSTVCKLDDDQINDLGFGYLIDWYK